MGERAIDDKTLSELEYSRRSPNWDEILFNPKWFLTDAIFYTMGLNPHTVAIKSIGDAVCTFNRNPYGLHRTEFIKRIESVLLSDLVDPATPDKVNTKDFLLWAAINPVFSGLPEPLLKFVVNNSVKVNSLTEQDDYLGILTQWVDKGLDKHLSHFDIAELWATPIRKNQLEVTQLEQKILKAVIDDELKGLLKERNLDSGDCFIAIAADRLDEIRNSWLGSVYVKAVIDRDDCLVWLKSIGEYPLTDGCLLARWFVGTTEQIKKITHEPELFNNDDNESGRRNKQVNKIVSIAKQYYPDLLAIPEGGKQIIKAECLKCKDLFTDSGFIEAWKVARAHNLVCMENVEKYQ